MWLVSYAAERQAPVPGLPANKAGAAAAVAGRGGGLKGLFLRRERGSDTEPGRSAPPGQERPPSGTGRHAGGEARGNGGIPPPLRALGSLQVCETAESIPARRGGKGQRTGGAVLTRSPLHGRNRSLFIGGFSGMKSTFEGIFHSFSAGSETGFSV